MVLVVVVVVAVGGRGFTDRRPSDQEGKDNVKLVRVQRKKKRPVEEEAEPLSAAAASFKYFQVPPTISQKALSAAAAGAPPAEAGPRRGAPRFGSASWRRPESVK